MALTSWSSSELSARLTPPLDSDVAVIFKNLAALSEEDQTGKQRREAQLEELAALLTAPDHATFKSFTPDVAELLINPDHNAHRNRDLAILCRSLVRMGYRYSDEVFHSPPSPSEKSSERVAYLQNHFTDDAYFILTSHLKNPSAAYFASISDVCEEVYHGLCEFCILPIESSEDGKLLRFYALIEKFDLKIVAVCDLENANGSYTRYALLRHKYVSFPTFEDSGTVFSEFDVITNSELSLSEILLTAELLGHRLVRADALPLPYRTDTYRYGLVFSSEQAVRYTDSEPSREESIEAFLLYLSLMAAEWSSLGIYSKIQE